MNQSSPQRFRAGPWLRGASSELAALRFATEPRYCPTAFPETSCPDCRSVDIFYHTAAAFSDDPEEAGWKLSCGACAIQVRTYPEIACVYCDRPASVKDHLIPLRLGGSLIVPACTGCNRAKGNHVPFIDWFAPEQLRPHVEAEAQSISWALRRIDLPVPQQIVTLARQLKSRQAAAYRDMDRVDGEEVK